MKKETKPKIVVISRKEMVKILVELKGATPATIEAETVVKMNKTSNPYWNCIFKTQRSNVFINFNYTSSVNRQLDRENKEQNFVAKPRPWGVKLPGTPIVMHNEETYLETRFLGSDPHIEYWYNGEPIDIEVFKQYLPPRKPSSAEHQGVDKEIIVRDFKMSSIKSIVLNKVKYILK